MNCAHYDVIVVGSGFGGAIVAYRLAKAGMHTLLLERGTQVKRDALDWSPKEVIIDKRYQGESPLAIKQYQSKKFVHTPCNETLGGMSVFYGGACFRLRTNDFQNWPIHYGDLAPYYDQAEQLLEVCGIAHRDPNEPARNTRYPYAPADFNKPAQRIFNAAKQLGLQPFPIPLALNFHNRQRPICIQCNTCDGFPCKIEAKNDLQSTVLQKAKRFAHFKLQTEIIVDRLVERNGHIVAIQCIAKQSGQPVLLHGKRIVLSAGSIESPAVLLRSGLEKFRQHRLIGKYLMRHCNAVVGCLYPFQTNPDNIFHKQVCISDFYQDFRHTHASATGIIQDIYTPATNLFKHFAPRWVRPFAKISRYTQNLLCVAEDDACMHNQVTLDCATNRYGMPITRVEHRYTQNDYARRDHLIRQAKKILKKAGGLFTLMMPIDSFSHAVGTLRFGDHPDRAVLDPYCRFFGVDNLYVVDGSFFPSSGGVNPSLTIAANALRVAEFIVADARNKGF